MRINMEILIWRLANHSTRTTGACCALALAMADAGADEDIVED